MVECPARTLDALALADRVLGTLRTPFRLAGVDLKIAASIGIAMASVHGRDAEVLMQRADCAMYQAKRTKAHVALYDADADHNTLRRLELAHELHGAIDDDQLVLNYQPKLELASGRTVGVEALVRWEHPRYGLLGPDLFIPLAETGGLIRQITCWVIRHGLAQLEEWRAIGIDLELALNVSAEDFGTEELYREVTAALTTSGVPADRLILELTERDVMTNQDQARGMMQRLRDIGIRISLDDFGTGQSSLAYLGALPIDELKIDRSFLAEDPSDTRRIVLANIIALGRALGHTVIAEGVEDLNTLGILAAAGCHQAQGYAISPPLSAVELESWLPGTDNVRVARFRPR